MQKKMRIILLFAVLFFIIPIAFADIAIPTVTNVYFENQGKPLNEPVDFTVTCYGYETGVPPVLKDPGTYTPTEVFKFSASCPEYGCEIQEGYYLNYRHIDYCNLSGTAEGKQFTIEKYGTSPVDFSKCKGDGSPNDLRKCELRFSIPTEAPIPLPQPQNPTSWGILQTLWKQISDFFSSLFGKGS